jgi:hypothetical protein
VRGATCPTPQIHFKNPRYKFSGRFLLETSFEKLAAHSRLVFLSRHCVARIEFINNTI